MENSETVGNTKEKMAPGKPPLRSISSFQELQKTIYRDATGTSNSPPQAPNENNKVENPPTENVVSGASIVDSTSTEQNMLDPKKLRRLLSNRRSSQRSRLKKLRFWANLEIQAKTFENQIAELQPQQASYQNQKQFFMLEYQTLHQEIEVLQKERLFIDAEDEKYKVELNRLRERRGMLQEQLRAQLLNLNIGLREPVSNPIPNFYTNSYQGNGVQTSHIPLEPSQMWIPAVPNMHEMNVTLPNYTGSMETNHVSGTPPNRNLN